MKKIILCTIAVLLINGCSKTPEEKIENLYQNGLEQISDYQYEVADSTFAQIFAIDSTSVKGLVGISKLNEARFQYYDAIKNYLIILTVSTDYEDAFVGLYNSYKNLGFYHEALEIAVHYNKIWHDNTQTKFLLGEAYKNLGDFKRAQSFFEQAVMSGYENKSAAQFMLATTLVLQDLKDDASQEASDAIAQKSETPLYYNSAAEYYETIGFIDTAIIYNQKLSQDNSNMNDIFLSYKRLLKNNYLSEARKMIQTLEGLQVEPYVLKGLQLFYSIHTDNKSRLSVDGLEYRAFAPYSLTGTMYELQTLAMLSDKMTISQCLSVLDVDISKGKYSAEFSDFYKYAMIMLYISYDKSPQTASRLDAITSLKRNRKEFKLEAALTKHIIGLYEESFSDLRKIESAHQNNPNWLTGVAEVWGHVGIRKYDIAEEIFQKALEANPAYYPAFNSCLEMFERTKKFDKALGLFKKYPQFEQNKFIALTKTKYLFLNKKYQEGINQFKQHLVFAPGNIILVNELIAILKSDNLSKEIEALVDLLDKNNPDVILLVAKMAQEKNDFVSSLSLVEQLVAVEPNNPEANIFKARALYYTGQKTEAYDLFEKNLIEIKGNPRNLLYYSQILSLEGIDFSRAANMARRAVFEGDGAYEYLVNLADVYYKMGRYDLCIGEGSKGLLEIKNDPYLYFRLGMAFSKSTKREHSAIDAKENLKKAKELGLSGEFLEEANNTLKSL